MAQGRPVIKAFSDVEAEIERLRKELAAPGVVKIGEYPVEGGFITADNLPQTFRHLRVLAHLRSTVAAANVWGRMQVNDLAANYNAQRLQAAGASVAASVSGGTWSWTIGHILGATAPAGAIATSDILLPHYTSGRVMQAQGETTMHDLAGGIMQTRFFGFLPTAGPVKKVRLTDDTATALAAESYATVYGIL